MLASLRFPENMCMHNCWRACLKAMDIPYTCVGYADSKSQARDFAKHNFGAKIRHMFHDVKCLSGDADGDSKCDMCGVCCCFGAERRPDLTTAGLPCQPFSQQRWHSGSGRNQQGPRVHKSWQTYMEFLHYLEVRRPRGFLCEEILKILSKDPVSKKRWLDLLLEGAAALGYGCAAAVLPTTPWSKVPRDRQPL